MKKIEEECPNLKKPKSFISFKETLTKINKSKTK